MIRLALHTVRALLAVAVLLASIALVLVGTRPGASLVLDAAQAWVPFDYVGVEGSLLRGLQFSQLSYSAEEVDVRAEGIALQANWRCLPRRQVCINALTMDELTVNLRAPAVPSARSPFAFLEDDWPWPPRLRVDKVAVTRLAVTLADGSVESAEDLHLTLRVGAKRIVVDTFTGRHKLLAWQLRGSAQRDGSWLVEGDLQPESQGLAAQGVRIPEALAVMASGDRRSLRANLVAGARSGDPAPVGLELVADVDPSTERFTLEGSLEGTTTLLPALVASPWTSTEGPLQFALAYDPEDMVLQLEQTLLAYAREPQPLRIVLREASALWALESLRLGPEDGPLITGAGSLGMISVLRPDLQLAFGGFTPPAAAELPVANLQGDVRLSMQLDHPLNSWTLLTPGLSLLYHAPEDTDDAAQSIPGERSVPVEISGRLAATDSLFLPQGDVQARSTGWRVDYRREEGASSPATVALPGGLVVGDFVLDALDASVAPVAGDALGGADLRITARGDLEADLELEIRSRGETMEFRIEPTELRIFDEALRVAPGVEGRWVAATRSIELQPLCLQWRRNRACTQEAVLGDAGELRVALAVDEDYQGSLEGKPYAVGGVGEGSLLLRWADRAALDASIDLTFSRLEFDPLLDEATAAPVAWDEAKLTARLTPAERRVNLGLYSQELGDLRLFLSEAGGALNGRLRLDALELGPFNDALPELSVQGGVINADLALSGTTAAPLLNGSLTLSGAQARIPDVDMDLQDIELDLLALGDRYELTGSVLAGGGELALAGQCCDGDEARATLRGKGNRLRLPLGLDATISPDLKLRLDFEKLIVTGLVSVDDGVLEHAGPRDGGVALSRDVRRIDLPEDPARRFDLLADLRTVIRPGFTVRSPELESTVSGDLRLSLRPNSPLELYGNLEVLGGELRAYGQALRLSRGAVGFVGDPLNPDLSLSAEREIRAERLRVGFRVRGTLEEPTLELFSDPVRSERDTLSYLLRGRGPDAGAAVDGTAMALSLGASAINSSGVLDSINSIPGLSGVTLGAEGSDEEMAATISAYVGQRLYLSYGVGIYEPVNALTARLYLRSRLWLEVVSRLESSFDIYYRFDID